jgi:hypothetical protein
VGLLRITNHNQPAIQRTNQESRCMQSSTNQLRPHRSGASVSTTPRTCASVAASVSPINRQPSSKPSDMSYQSSELRASSERSIYKTNSFDRKYKNCWASNFIPKTAFSLFEYFFAPKPQTAVHQPRSPQSKAIPATRHTHSLTPLSVNTQAIELWHNYALTLSKHQPVASCRPKATPIAQKQAHLHTRKVDSTTQSDTSPIREPSLLQPAHPQLPSFIK